MGIDRFSGVRRWMSNFYSSSVEMDGLVYPSVEHAYQAAKTTNNPTRLRILDMTAAQAKTVGNSVPLRSDWEEVKLSIMLSLLRKKFAPDTDLADRLLKTEEEELVEGNWWHDNFWGNCTCVKCKDIPGQNHLGRLLMQVRSELKPSI